MLAAQPMQNESRIENNFHLNTKFNTTFEAPNPLEAEWALSQLAGCQASLGVWQLRR